jgi:hypothetical protein
VEIFLQTVSIKKHLWKEIGGPKTPELLVETHFTSDFLKWTTSENGFAPTIFLPKLQLEINDTEAMRLLVF